MTEARMNRLAEELIRYSMELKDEEYIATKDRNFEELKRIANINEAIDVILNDMDERSKEW